MPDLSHLWQRFVLATALVFGLVVGIGATIFGYSNTATVTLGFAVFQLHNVPLWAVAIVPVVLVLLASTLYHWWSSLHHFTEHMRHRRRVHELEAEVTTLKAHLDQLLEMPGGSETKPPVKPSVVEPLPVEKETEPVSSPVDSVPVNGEEPSAQKAS